MVVEKVFINTYKYDFQFARICIASVRYWYPEADIFLIKDIGAGNFSTRLVEQKWNVKIFETARKKFGWGYGKLEPLFMGGNESFLILDADTVITGPVIDKVKDLQVQFVVDDEVQPAERFNEIYYHLDRIHEIDKNFTYPGYSFNSGQWFGTAGILSRQDFEKTLEWSDPPKTRFPAIIFNNDQTQLNFVVHKKEQMGKLSVKRIKLMVWPASGSADFMDLEKIRQKAKDFPFVIHWAGMRFKKITDLPRPDILLFYKRYYYSKMNKVQPLIDKMNFTFLYYEKRAVLFLRKIKMRFSN